MLYFGPETYMPLASAAAAVAGILLAFWRRLVGMARRLVHTVHRGHSSAARGDGSSDGNGVA